MRALAALALLSACYMPAAQEPPRVALKARFDPATVAWARAEGENAIEGSALLRTRGGDVRTCAALTVGVMPVSASAKERMMHLYGSTLRGFNAAHPYGNHPVWENENLAFYDEVRASRCDADGMFRFDALPDGEWYVEATVTWQVGYGVQGGSLMQLVRVEGVETERVMLTAD